jgi:hypothetical protein
MNEISTYLIRSSNTKKNLNSVFIILVQVTHFWVGVVGGWWGVGDKRGIFSPTNPLACFTVGDSQSYHVVLRWGVTTGLCLTSGCKDSLSNRRINAEILLKVEYNRIE